MRQLRSTVYVTNKTLTALFIVPFLLLHKVDYYYYKHAPPPSNLQPTMCYQKEMCSNGEFNKCETLYTFMSLLKLCITIQAIPVGEVTLRVINLVIFANLNF